MRRRPGASRVTRQSQSRRRAARKRDRPWSWLAFSALLFFASLGAVIHVSAVPAEEQTQETWYGYRQEMRYDFTARVRPGPVYERDLVSSAELAQVKLPVDPPVYRRVLVGPMAESVRVTLPYSFTADRPGQLRVTYAVDGQISVPNLWRRPFPLLPPQSRRIEGAEVRLNDLVLEIPIGTILDQVKRFSEAEKVPFDQLEILLRPTVTVEVEGQREPIVATLAPEFLLQVRNGGVAVEIDEPRTVQDAKEYQVNERVPLAVRVWGREVPVARIQQGAYFLLGLFTLVLVGVLANRYLLGRTERSPAEALRRLGGGLIRATEFDLPEGVAMIDVTRLEYLMHLHLQTERPVVQVGKTFYLLDGGSCYIYGRN